MLLIVFPILCFTNLFVATKVFYNDIIIDSQSGGQQGCPLMMACHAMVQRMTLESLGVVEARVGGSVTVPVVSPPVNLSTRLKLFSYR